MDMGRQLAHSQDISTKVSILFQKRVKMAQERFTEQLKKAYEDNGVGGLLANPASRGERLVRLVRVRGRTPRSARSCSGTRCASAATTSSSTTQAGLPPVLHFDYETVRRRAQARAAGQLRAGAHRSAGGRDGRSEAAALRDHRPARRPRPRHRRLQGRLAGRRRAARRAPGLLRDLLPRSGAGPDAARRLRGRAAVRAQGARAASRRARSRRSSATARAAGRR